MNIWKVCVLQMEFEVKRLFLWAVEDKVQEGGDVYLSNSSHVFINEARFIWKSIYMYMYTYVYLSKLESLCSTNGI